MKSGVTLVAVGIVVAAIIIWMVDAPEEAAAPTNSDSEVAATAATDEVQAEFEAKPASARELVAVGAYEVDPERSSITWAGKKPLIDGYINSGTLKVSSGEIIAGENTATGEFVIDMNTLSVGATQAKPGSESALEGHLRGGQWFDVETYPEASFVITEVTANADSETTFMYNVTGDLTMKGVTDSLSFPAMIYLDDEGYLRADASFEFDRTKWGITAGSGSFFDSLADNVIDDMVQLSFSLVAED